MLTKNQREKIRSIADGKSFIEKKNDFNATSVRRNDVPDVFELREQAIEKIKELGFTEIIQVAPKNANCIIRVFSRFNLEHEINEMYSIYGYNCYTKSKGIWITGKDFEISFSKCKRICWIFQDEYVDFDCDFVDFYVKVS